MGKKSRNKKNRKSQRSALAQHQKIGKNLIPPMMKSPLGETFEFHSWIDDGLPEMLWACLVISVIPRNDALMIFEKVAALGFKYRDEKNGCSQWGLSHSLLGKMPNDIFDDLIKIVTFHPLGYVALRPLLLLESLPNLELWKSGLDVDAENDDWDTLTRAVAVTLDHQSQEATDVRWVVVMFFAALGLISIPMEMKDKLNGIINYRNGSDMRSVRPIIRTMELCIRGIWQGKHLQSTDKIPDNWSSSFWQECLKATPCIAGKLKPPSKTQYDIHAINNNLRENQLILVKHFFSTISTTAVDAKHDAIFGFGLYALTLLAELLEGNNRHNLTGRLILRALVDCRINLSYLLSQGDTELWYKFRKFGAGQAKLVLLKLDDLEEGDKPSFLNESMLEQMANEDIDQEFLSIDLGQWCGKDLRKMAEISGTKDDYDKYYSWTSAYIHGNWATIKTTCFVPCYNPLHRLHQVPTLSTRIIDDVILDGVVLVNHILADINKTYPELDVKILVSELTSN